MVRVVQLTQKVFDKYGRSQILLVTARIQIAPAFNRHSSADAVVASEVQLQGTSKSRVL